MHPLRRLAHVAVSTARRIIVAVVGGTIVLLGVVMLVTPGPGIVVLIVGLGVLALEFAWARRWLRKLKQTTQTAVDHVRGGGDAATEGPERGKSNQT